MIHPDPLRVIIGGDAGQGAVTAGILAAEAAVRGGRYAVQTAVTGAAVRSGDADAHVIISHSFAAYPYVETPDVLIALSRRAADRHSASVSKTGMVMFDPTLARIERRHHWDMVPIDGIFAMQQSNLGKEHLNLFWLGAFAALTDAVSIPHLLEAVPIHLPRLVFKEDQNPVLLGYMTARRLYIAD